MMESLPDDMQPVEPDVPAWCEPAWRAFQELGAERPRITIGYILPMGGASLVAQPGLLPWTATHAWCDRADQHGEDREVIVSLVRRLDDAYLNWWHAQHKRSMAGDEGLDAKLARWEEG